MVGATGLLDAIHVRVGAARRSHRPGVAACPFHPSALLALCAFAATVTRYQRRPTGWQESPLSSPCDLICKT